MNRTTLLKADAVINLILGILLMAFPAGLVKALGIPMSDLPFLCNDTGRGAFRHWPGIAG